MVSAVTPCHVAPPLSLPAGQGITQDGRHVNDTRSFLTDESQSGAASAAGVLIPALVGAWPAATARASRPLTAVFLRALPAVVFVVLPTAGVAPVEVPALAPSTAAGCPATGVDPAAAAAAVVDVVA